MWRWERFPSFLRVHSRVHRVLQALGVQAAELAELQGVVVGGDDIVAVIGVDFLSADDGGDHDGILFLAFQLSLQQLALFRARRHAGCGYIGGIVDFDKTVHI